MLSARSLALKQTQYPSQNDLIKLVHENIRWVFIILGLLRAKQYCLVDIYFRLKASVLKRDKFSFIIMLRAT